MQPMALLCELGSRYSSIVVVVVCRDYLIFICRLLMKALHLSLTYPDLFTTSKQPNPRTHTHTHPKAAKAATLCLCRRLVCETTIDSYNTCNINNITVDYVQSAVLSSFYHIQRSTVHCGEVFHVFEQI